VILSIVEEHSCICSTINSQWNRQEAVCFFFPAKARIHVINIIYKRYKTEWLRKKKKIDHFIFKKYAIIQLHASLKEEKDFMNGRELY